MPPVLIGPRKIQERFPGDVERYTCAAWRVREPRRTTGPSAALGMTRLRVALPEKVCCWNISFAPKGRSDPGGTAGRRPLHLVMVSLPKRLVAGHALKTERSEKLVISTGAQRSGEICGSSTKWSRAGRRFRPDRNRCGHRLDRDRFGPRFAGCRPSWVPRSC
jgi:hypothetical protein